MADRSCRWKAFAVDYTGGLSQWCTHHDFSQSIWIENSDAYDLLNKKLSRVDDVSCARIINNSQGFPTNFPVKTVTCAELSKNNHVSETNLERYANSAYPIIHDRILQFCAQFLLDKTSSAGSEVEKDFYRDMDVISFIDRLLIKRAVVFLGHRDSDEYWLLDHSWGLGGWETIGIQSQEPPVELKHCLSYEEIKFSALLSVSSYTYFLNPGNRTNKGVRYTARENIECEGVIIGLSGARFEKTNFMEYQDIIRDLTQEEGTKDGTQERIQDEEEFNIFIDMYESSDSFVRDKVLMERNWETMSRFTEYKKHIFFDNAMYAKRIALSFDTLLHEANARAKEKGTTAFIHVVGFGLGRWLVSPHQRKAFVDVCVKRIEQLGEHLSSVSDVCFSHINVDEAGEYRNGDVISIEPHPKGGIKIHIAQRNPHQKLTDDDKGKLLVVSYTSNGNAQPGNEFWAGSLSASGNSAAASSTQVAELHNAHINPKVCASNLRVVTSCGVLTISQYQEEVKQQRDLERMKRQRELEAERANRGNL